MIANVERESPWRRYEFNPDVPRPHPATCPERPYAWRNVPPNPSVIERKGEELFLNGRRVLVQEIDTRPHLTLGEVREQLLGHLTPDESVNAFLREHKWLVPEPLLRRELMFFGSARQYPTCVTISCLVVGASMVSSRYCTLDSPWNEKCAALYLETAS